MYKIGLFSQISKTTIKTLHYYDEIGLLTPEMIDEENGYRYYSTDQLFKLHKISSLKQMGFSIEDIKSIIDGHNIDEILLKRKKDIENELLNTEEQLSRINHYILEIKEEKKMNYNAVLKELPECIVYSKRMIVPSYDAYFSVIPEIGEEIKKANPNLKCAVPEYCFIVYHDGEYKEKDIDVEYCEAVTEFGNETESIKFKKLPSVTAITVMHKGPYTELGNAYAYIFKWIEENGYKAISSPRESYIDGIWNKESENDWLTELQVPVVKK
jgi:DNA-binding transcriptional MerR regulator/DNA gyrase inhibitor GyrI